MRVLQSPGQHNFAGQGGVGDFGEEVGKKASNAQTAPCPAESIICWERKVGRK